MTHVFEAYPCPNNWPSRRGLVPISDPFFKPFPLFCIEGTVHISDPPLGPQISVPESYPRVTCFGGSTFGYRRLFFFLILHFFLLNGHQQDPKKNMILWFGKGKNVFGVFFCTKASCCPAAAVTAPKASILSIGLWLPGQRNDSLSRCQRCQWPLMEKYWPLTGAAGRYKSGWRKYRSVEQPRCLRVQLLALLPGAGVGINPEDWSTLFMGLSER